MINIIIPAYNAHLTIEKTISSIVSQTAKDLISVIIVNDGSKKDYSFIVKKYSKFIKIQEITNEKNEGVGVTRQKGLDAVDQPYFAFIDADDSYINCGIIEKVIDVFEKNKKIVLVSSSFIEENKLMQQNTVNSIKGFHGKFYRTDFIREKNIKVPNTRLSEDSMFNRAIMLALENKTDKIYELKEVSYYWRYNKNSLTSKLKETTSYQLEYIKSICFVGSNKNIKEEIKNEYYIQAFFVIYLQFNKNLKEQIKEKTLIKQIADYYNKYIKTQNIVFSEEMIKKSIRQASGTGLTEKENISFLDFLKLLGG